MSLNFSSKRRLARDGFSFSLRRGVNVLDRQDSFERREAAGSELAPRGPTELRKRLRRRPGGSVVARCQHRVERVRDVDDPGPQRKLFALPPVWLARPA